jgi:N-acetylmuramate 1-kinase
MLRSDIGRLCGSKWEFAEVSYLPADASDRRFIRLSIKGATLIVVDSSLEKRKIPAYVAISSLLREYGFSAPTVYNVDYDSGYLVVEDLGLETLGKIAARDPGNRAKLCESVIEILPALQTIPQSPLVYEYSVDRLLDELKIYLKWYCTESHAMSPDASRAFTEEWRKVLSTTIAMEPLAVFVHKDFHFDNLMWIDSRTGYSKIGILDFQDAKFGSRVYDLLSILEDPRYPLGDDLRRELLSKYVARHTSLRGICKSIYAVYAVQRSLKILGNIYYLSTCKGKKGYLKLEERVRRTISREINEPLLADIESLLASTGLLNCD